MAICTNCAHRVIEIVGRREVRGYSSHENPGTEAASGQGGHDFAVIDNRLLIDVWLCFFAGLSNRAVFDLSSEQDSADIKRLYGNRKLWHGVAKSGQ